MTTRSDLFKKLKKPDTPVDSDVESAPSVSEMIRTNLEQLTEHDQMNATAIQTNTDKLISHLSACDGIVDAAYQLRKYVPDTVTTEQDKIWKEEIIPNMLKFVSQDVKARSILTHAYGTVRDLGITVQKASELVYERNGSPRSIENAKQVIPAALAKLDEYIEKASNFEQSTVNSFASDSEKLFQIIGEEAGNFVKRRSDIEKEYQDLVTKQNELWDNYVKSIGEANKYSYLHSATQKHLSDEENASEATKLRILDLELKNQENETKIEEIGTKVIDSVTVKYRSNWSFRRTKKTTFYEMSKNPDRDAEKEYYESLILARMARLNLEKSNNESNQNKIAQLIQVAAEYQTKYEQAKTKSENLKKYLQKEEKKLKNQFDLLNKNLDELNDDRNRVEKKMGLSGNALLECLICIHKYSKEIKDGSNALGPLASILRSIKAMVESDINMLSGDEADIFAAGNRLLKFARFISRYNVSSHAVLETSREKQQLSLQNGETNVEELEN